MLSMSPVKDLHSNFWKDTKKRNEIDFSDARFRIRMQLELLAKLPSCYVVDFANRPAACKCLSEASLSEESIAEAANFLQKFAMLRKEQQQTLIIQWITYATADNG